MVLTSRTNSGDTAIYMFQFYRKPNLKSVDVLDRWFNVRTTNIVARTLSQMSQVQAKNQSPRTRFYRLKKFLKLR